MKKIFVLLMAAVMALAVPASVLAEEWDDIIFSEEDYEASEGVIEVEEPDAIENDEVIISENEADSEIESEPLAEEIQIQESEAEIVIESIEETPDVEEPDEDTGITLLDAESDIERTEWIELTSDGGELESGMYYLVDDVQLTTDITISSSAEVTIDLNGYALKGTGYNSVITNYGTFTLDDSSGNNSGTLTGPTNLEYGVSKGGGVCNCSGASFTFDGGNITGNMTNNGGGVYNDYSSIFTMTGGMISGNKAYGGGGVCNLGDFTMIGGEINGNSTQTHGEGGGVENVGTFTMKDSVINGNSAGNLGGGGVSNGGTFIMTESEICENSSSYGGGVYNSDTLSITDSKICGNTCNDNPWGEGGGILSEGTLTLTNSKIYNNVSSGDGGGLYLSGTCFMTDSEVSGNNVSGSNNPVGGGVFLNSGTLSINDSSINNNSLSESNGEGGGIYKSTISQLTLEGTVEIRDNTVNAIDNNFFLTAYSNDYPTWSYIKLDEVLNEGSSIGVTTETKPASGQAVQITRAEDSTEYYKESAQYFFSDEGYIVQANESGRYVELEGPFDLSGGTVKLSSTSYTYDGKAKTPSVTVTYDGISLAEVTDYTVSYSNNTNAGTATVTVTGKGNYTGTVTKNFTINKANQTVTAKTAASSIEVGKTTTITASGKGTISYSSSNTSVATVSSKGVVTGKATGTATITLKAAGNSNYNSASTTIKITVTASTSTVLKKGSSYTSGDFIYKILTLPSSGTGTVQVTGPAKSSIKTAAIPAKVAIGDRTFKVTEIGAKAFKGCKKLTTVSTGKNVTVIGNQAFQGCTNMTGVSIQASTTTIGKKVFYNCQKLKKIVIKSKQLTSVGKNTFKGIKSKATIKVPKSKLKAYTKLLKGKGQGSKVKITS